MIYLLNIVIFHGYVKKSEGIFNIYIYKNTVFLAVTSIWNNILKN